MNKFLIPLLLSLIHNFLYANDSIFISPKVALKMIDKKNITFINLSSDSVKIKKSKNLDIKNLNSSDILGRMPCSPFYACRKTIEKYFSDLGIDNNEELVIYDDSYGIDAATLYVVLESMGHKNVSILRGGVEDISTLDPNGKIYKDYLDKLKANDLNQTSLKQDSKKIMQKINMLKPHLLFDDINLTNLGSRESNYTVTTSSTNFFLSKKELKQAVKLLGSKESNITIIDACAIIDIAKNSNDGSHTTSKALSWRELIDKKKKHLKSNEELQKLFDGMSIKKTKPYYVYCMIDAPKAFYLMVVLRELGYAKVKAFTGDWNTWIGDIDE